VQLDRVLGCAPEHNFFFERGRVDMQEEELKPTFRGLRHIVHSRMEEKTQSYYPAVKGTWLIKMYKIIRVPPNRASFKDSSVSVRQNRCGRSKK